MTFLSVISNGHKQINELCLKLEHCPPCTIYEAMKIFSVVVHWKLAEPKIITKVVKNQKFNLNNFFLCGQKGIDFLTTCIWLAIKKTSAPFTLTHLLKTCNVKKSSLTPHLKFYAQHEVKTDNKSSPPQNFISFWCKHLNLDHETEAKAKTLMDKAQNTEAFYGKFPSTIAATALYLSCTPDVDILDKISKVSTLDTKTIRNTAMLFSRHLLCASSCASSAWVDHPEANA